MNQENAGVADAKKFLGGHHSLGRLYRDLGQLDSSLFYLKTSTPLLAKINEKEVTVKHYLELADLNTALCRQDESSLYLENVNALKPLSPFSEISYLESMGRLYENTESYDLAIKSIVAAEDQAVLSGIRNSHVFKSKRLLAIARLHKKQDSLSDALDYFQQALIACSVNFVKDSIAANPEVQLYLHKSTALEILHGKARTLFQYYMQSDSIDYLLLSHETYTSATELIKFMRRSILTNDSKHFLQERSGEVFEGAIETSLRLADHYRDSTFLRDAFLLAESSKAMQLLENMNEQLAKGLAIIPDSLIEKERQIRYNLAYLTKEQLREAYDGKSKSKISDQIFELQHGLDELLKKFERDYPHYHNLKYRAEALDLNALHKQLNLRKSILLEYFVGQEKIYVFRLFSGNIECFELARTDDITESIFELRDRVSQPPSSFNTQDEFLEFNMLASFLYDKLLGAVLQGLDFSTGLKLIVVPDLELNYIPFEVLMPSQAKDETRGYSLSNMNYLLEHLPVSYSYSVKLLLRDFLSRPAIYENEFVGFAPTFNSFVTSEERSCSYGELSNLACNQDEVHSINELLKGKEWLSNSAIKRDFEIQAKSSRIVHLATHACVDEDPQNHRVFFADDYLTSLDLYNMDMNVGMAVLSACNTGSGKVVKGEGVMSLARGFINAGCSSTIMSRWSVDDCATSDLMLEFYNCLYNGHEKDRALQLAKLHYLDSVEKHRMHPYYWSSFIPFGNMESISLDRAKDRRPIALLILLSVFSGAFSFLRMKKRSPN